MNKRKLYKNKIIRFYEEDIWGLFYKKQLRRDFFFKKFMYLFFLTKLFKELSLLDKGSRYTYTYKSNISYLLFNIFKIRVYFESNIRRDYFKKSLKKLILFPKFIKGNSKYINQHDAYVMVKKNKKKNDNSLKLKKFNNNLKLKYANFLIKKLKYFKQIKKIIYKLFFLFNKKNKFIKINLFKNLKKKLCFFNKYINNNNLYKIYIISSILNKKNNKLIYNLKLNQLNRLKELILINYNFKKSKDYDFEYQYISFKYFKFLKSNINKKKLYLKLFLLNTKINFKFGTIKLMKMYNFLFNLNLYLNKEKIVNNSFFCFYHFILFFLSLKQIKKNIKKIKRIKYYLNNNDLNLDIKYFFNNKNIFCSILNLNIIVKNYLLNYLNKNIKYFYNKYIYSGFIYSSQLKSFSIFYVKYYLIKFLNLTLVKFKNVKNKKIFYVLRKIVNLNQYIFRRIKKMKYFLRNFYYQKFNKYEDKDSLFYSNKIDLTKLDISKIKTKKDRENNFVLLNYINFLNKKKEYMKNYQDETNVALKYIITKPNISFSKTEYLLSFYASGKIYKIFKKLRVFYFVNMLSKINKLNKNNISNSNLNNIFNKYSKILNIKFDLLIKKQRFYSIKKKKTALQKIFTLNLVPIVKYVKKKNIYNSFYKYKMLKIWKFRKFYGCLTNYELKRICYKAYKYHGDILLQFIILLESRIDTLLYRTGLVSSIFEARQLINHKNILINNKVIDKRSFTLKKEDILLINKKIYLNLLNKTIFRINTEGILFRPPIYLEVNFKLYMVIFLFDILKVKQVPFNFNLTGEDLNTILYYYY